MSEVIFIFLGGLSGLIVFSFWWYKGICFLENNIVIFECEDEILKYLEENK